jgi:hypothetical protein
VQRSLPTNPLKKFRLGYPAQHTLTGLKNQRSNRKTRQKAFNLPAHAKATSILLTSANIELPVRITA